MSEVIDPPVEFWALPYREKGQRKLLYSFDGPVSPRYGARYGAYILKSAYDQLQARLTKCESMRETACANALMFNKQNIELQAENRRLNLICEQEFGRADSVGELVKRCAELEKQVGLLIEEAQTFDVIGRNEAYAEVDRLRARLAAAEAALKHDVDKIEAAYINERTELLHWADRLAAALTWISKSEGLLGQAKQSLVEFQAWRERRGEG